MGKRVVIQLRASEEEKKAYQAAADAEGMALSEWMRGRLKTEGLVEVARKRPKRAKDYVPGSTVTWSCRTCKADGEAPRGSERADHYVKNPRCRRPILEVDL